MDGLPKKEQSKRDKKSLISWYSSKDTTHTPHSDKKETHRPTRIIASAPPALADKTIDPKRKDFISNTSVPKLDHDQRKIPALPKIIATQQTDQKSHFSLTELITEEQRNPRKNERSKHAISRSLSPAKKEVTRPIPEKLSSSDPGGKSIFRKSKEKSPRKTTISPQKSPKNTPAPTDFASALEAIRNEDIHGIKSFLENPENNPNEQNISKNTLLHYTVLTAKAKNNPLLLMAFVHNPYIDFLRKNQDDCIPCQFIAGDDIAKHKNIFALLYPRTLLAHVVHSLIISDEKLIVEEYDDKIMRSKIKALLNRVAENVLPGYADCAFILTMVKSQLKNNLNILKIVHDCYINNPNHEDEWGDTMLHHCTRVRDAQKVKKLVKDPQVISKRNKDGLFPQGLLDSLEKNVSKIRSMLFSRGSIDSWIEKEVEGLLFTNPLVNTLKVDDPCFKNVKSLMEITFTKVENAQKEDDLEEMGRTLPKEQSQIPTYATDKFLLALFHTHMKVKKGNNPSTIIACNHYPFNPYPSSTESSDSKEDKKVCTKKSLTQQLSAIEEQIMEEMESGKIKPIGSDSSLVALDSSSSLTFFDKKS